MLLLAAVGGLCRALPQTALANDGRWHMGGWGPMMGFGYGGMLMGILFIVLIVLVIYLVVRAASHRGPERTHVDSSAKTPLDILKERYARGEIDEEEFNRRKKNLA